MKTATKSRQTQTRGFLFILALFAIAVAVRYFDNEVNAQDTTIYAFNYTYGFISRGFMGSVLLALDKLLPWNMMTYKAIYAISVIGTIGFYVCLFSFYKLLLDSADDKNYSLIQLLIVIISIYAFPNFVTWENFGRVDVFLAIIMLASMMLIMKEKLEWLVIPLCMLAMLMHQGFIFMNINIILVMLFAKALLNEDEKKRKNYWILFGILLLSCSALFLYFEFFSHVSGTDIYKTVKATARALSSDGKSYAPGIVNHEILGEGVFMDEWDFHVINYWETAEFIILFLPYIVIAGRFCIRLIKSAEGIAERLVYLAVVLGPWTVIPEIILKIDYGRYVYEVVFYYLAIVMILISGKLIPNNKTEGIVTGLVSAVKNDYLAAGFFVAYPMIMMPLLDVLIANNVSMALVNWLGIAP